MDELFQRYRAFWRPVVMGLGVFLLGVIVVHAITPDPEEEAARAAQARRELTSLVLPGDRAAAELKADVAGLGESATRLATAFDPASGGADWLPLLVRQVLDAAFEADSGEEAAREAERLAKDRSSLFRTGNPNVAFSALLSDVWGVLRVRANRADMDLDADLLGFSNVPSITRPELRRRLANLAVVTRITAAAIKNGAVSLDEVRFEARPTTGPDSFLQEWPVTVILTAPTRCVEAVLQLLTDPRAPVPVGTTSVQQPRRSKAGLGIVELSITVDSVAVNPAATLNLDSEEEGS